MRTLGRAFREEASAVLRNPGALLVLIGAISIYAVFYPVPYSPEVLKQVPIVLVDLDRSELSRTLARMADANEYLDVRSMATSLGEAEQLVREQKAGGILYIPHGFEQTVMRGEQAWVASYADASYLLIYRQVLTGMLRSAGTLSAAVEIKRLAARGAGAGVARTPIEYLGRPLFNPVEGYATFVVPSVLILILQQTILIGVGLVSGSRRELGMASLDAGAVPMVVLGRAAFYLILYWLHAWFYLGPLSDWYGFPRMGDPLVLVLFTQPYLLSVIFLSLAGAAFFRERQQPIQVFAVMSLPMVLVSGVVWPRELIPEWILTLSAAIPSTAAIAGYLRMNMMGANLAEVGPEYGHLWILAGVYFLLACVAQRAVMRIQKKAAKDPEPITPSSAPRSFHPAKRRKRNGIVWPWTFVRGGKTAVKPPCGGRSGRRARRHAGYRKARNL